ncbi:MAG: hypothetical protein EBU31_01095 [Proteobacteria bacterium]|nr:hypothetical protein [Pseudomonadota bacterium]
MNTLSALHCLTEQIPPSIRDQFEISLMTDSYFLAPTARFRHTGGVVIEARIETNLSATPSELQIVIPAETIARLCIIAR